MLNRAAKARLVGALAGGLLVAGFGPAPAVAASTTTVDLGQAATYAVLSGASVANTVSAPGAPHTTLRGDLGVKANSQPTGFPPGLVTGTTRVGATADQAHADLVAAYTEVAGRTGGAPLASAMAGMTISPGLHTIAGAASNTGTVTLDGGGNPNAVFVFQVNGALSFAAGSHVVLTNGAKASRVFWQVNGAGNIGANADFVGTLMALDAVGIGNGSVVNGRALARDGAVTLDNNQFFSAAPVVSINGGASVSTTDTTPTISGFTDIDAPGTITVTVAGQTLTTTHVGGAWSVTSAILANGTYPVTASVADAPGNPASATQQLTVDTVLPIITLDGGPSMTTSDATATISGTSDMPAETVVRVTVDSQTLRALVQPGGTWNVRPAALAAGDHVITATVIDLAANEGTDSQVLTVVRDEPPPKDTTAPGTTIVTGPHNRTTRKIATYRFTSSEAGSSFECKVDKRRFRPCISPTTFKVHTGIHKFKVRATDPTGNVDPSPARDRFRVE